MVNISIHIAINASFLLWYLWYMVHAIYKRQYTDRNTNIEKIICVYASELRNIYLAFLHFYILKPLFLSMHFPLGTSDTLSVQMTMCRQYNVPTNTDIDVCEQKSEKALLGLANCPRHPPPPKTAPPPSGYANGTSEYFISETHIFSGLKLHLQAVSFYYLWYMAL